MKRPLSIWLTQSLLITFALVFLSVLLVNLVMRLSHFEQEFSVIRAVIGYSVILCFVLVLVVAFWGLARRAMYGRWLGVLSLILIWGLLILVTVRRPSGPYQYYEYDNNAQRAGAVIVHVLLNGLMLLLVVRLSFSKKIRKFFAKQV